MVKFPVRASMKASFLHDEDIDWDALGLLEASERDGAASPSFEARADGEANGKAGAVTDDAACEQPGADADGNSSPRRAALVGSSGRRRSSVTFDDLEEGSLHSSSHSSSGDGDGHFPPDGTSTFAFGRQPSVSTLAASHSSKQQSPHELAATVAKKVQADFASQWPSRLVRECDQRDVLAPYASTEIVLGPLLGKGEFSHVYEIKAFRPDPKLESTLAEHGRGEEVSTRKNMKRRERYHDTKKACYAVKHLQPDLVERYSRLEYAQAAADLALEAEFLSRLQHPNIIKLRGISYAGPRGFEFGPKGYFLLIDRLDETLDGRIRRWRKGRRGGLTSSWKEKVERVKKLRQREGHGGRRVDAQGLVGEDQVDVGLRIASALVYLHERNIMFRDLKPQNIGFDVRGDVKLFDFGLSKVIPESSFLDPYEDKYEMSGAGSPRYMAPEVLVDPPEKYNLKADVYTFSLVLWEIFSLELPYKHIRRRDELTEYVVDQDGRPEIHEDWPEPIKEALNQSFDPVIERRPAMPQFYNVLRFHLISLRDGDDSELSNTQIKKRRSFESMRQLGLNADGTAIGGGQLGQEGQPNSPEKLPQRVRNTIMGPVSRPSPEEQTLAGTDDAPQASPQRRRTTRARLRDKLFRLSAIKQEE